MSGPLVSIVILSWNRYSSTRSTLRALANVPAGVPREVIVVDNGSGIQTIDELMALKREGLIDRLVLLPENRGTSPGYNAGFRAADPRSRFFTKLDNDIEILTRDWLKELVGLLDASPSVGIASTEIVNHVGIQELPILHLEPGHQVRDWIGCPAGGGGMTFRRSLYEEIGGFRENYGEGLLLMPDDLEFFFRVRERNLMACYSHAVQSRTIDHLEESSTSYRAFKKRQYFLLRTRYFDLARAGSSVFVPHLVTVEAVPTLVYPGQTVTVRCSIAAGDQRRMTLGCTVASAETNSVADCSATSDVHTAAPLSMHELSLRIPPTLPPGRYLVKTALWRDSTAAEVSERLADLVQLSEPLEVAARDSIPAGSRAARYVSFVVEARTSVPAMALDARLGLSRATFHRPSEGQVGACGCELAAWSYLQRRGHEVTLLPEARHEAIPASLPSLDGPDQLEMNLQGGGLGPHDLKMLEAAPPGTWVICRLHGLEVPEALAASADVTRAATGLGYVTRTLAEMAALREYPPDAGSGRETCGRPGPGLEQWGRPLVARHPVRRRNEVGPEVIRLLRLLGGAGRKILHVDVGDSALAANLAGAQSSVRGIAFSDSEVQAAQRLQLGASNQVTREDALPHLREGAERFDIIVDVGLLGLHCCRQHFTRRVEFLTSLLGREGLIVAPVVPEPQARPAGLFQPGHVDLLFMEHLLPLRVLQPGSTLYVLSTKERAAAAAAFLESRPPLPGGTAPLTIECVDSPASARKPAAARALELRVCLEDQTPLRSTPYELRLPDGSVRLGHTDPSGYICENLPSSPLLLARQGELTGRTCLTCGPRELVLSR